MSVTFSLMESAGNLQRLSLQPPNSEALQLMWGDLLVGLREWDVMMSLEIIN